MAAGSGDVVVVRMVWSFDLQPLNMGITCPLWASNPSPSCWGYTSCIWLKFQEVLAGVLRPVQLQIEDVENILHFHHFVRLNSLCDPPHHVWWRLNALKIHFFNAFLWSSHQNVGVLLCIASLGVSSHLLLLSCILSIFTIGSNFHLVYKQISLNRPINQHCSDRASFWQLYCLSPGYWTGSKTQLETCSLRHVREVPLWCGWWYFMCILCKRIGLIKASTEPLAVDE